MMADVPLIPLAGDEQLDELHGQALALMPEVEREIRHRLGGNRILAAQNAGIFRYSREAVAESLRETCRQFVNEGQPPRLFAQRIREQIYFLSWIDLPTPPEPERSYAPFRSYIDRGGIFERTDDFCIDR
jgi:hypothetical protein